MSSVNMPNNVTTNQVMPSTPSAIENKKERSLAMKIAITTGKVALIALGVVALAFGSFLAIKGGIVLTKMAMASSVFKPLVAFGLPLAAGALQLTAALCSNPVTALGAIFTLPVALIGASPLILPFLAGALPGAALATLGGFSFAIWDVK